MDRNSKNEVESSSIMTAVRKHFIKHLIAGIVSIIPLVITIFVIRGLFRFMDGFLSPFVEQIFERKIFGLGFVFTVTFLYILGVLSSSLAVKDLLGLIEGLFNKIPLVRSIYDTMKRLVDSFSDPEKHPFQKVVIVKFLKNRHSIGFVTNHCLDKNGEKYIAVYIPMAPHPNGFLGLTREDKVFETTLSVEEGIKLALSAGSASPKNIS